MSHLIRGARLLSPADGYDGQVMDIFCSNGRISAIGERIEPTPGTAIVEARDLWVSPGWIDSHVHCYPAVSLGLQADRIGVESGVTTLIDAGSAGSGNFEDFLQSVILPSRTRVYALLNIAKTGLATRNELSDPANLDLPAARETAVRHSGRIVGVKARASRSVVGECGLAPIQTAARTARELALPLVVHLGNAPPAVEESLSVLEEGDVAAHVYSGKENSILNPDGLVKREFRMARARGVLMDVAHGQESFSFAVYRKAALEQEFTEDLASTDLHRFNAEGPVESLALTLSKLLTLGRPLGELIREVTDKPAAAYRLTGLGHLTVGAAADLTLFALRATGRETLDADGSCLTLTQELLPQGVITSNGAATTWLPAGQTQPR